ncbi:MAG: hypothetical protein UR39_C0011G0015 [Candidatus Woesebacteria bacterium GW2011_GWA1_33_30]|nr:MAG: hypothetical protein UR39_C0011G0015 [Candidatus Woesebacteria bacterium GW2011_GWA1_33_30]
MLDNSNDCQIEGDFQCASMKMDTKRYRCTDGVLQFWEDCAKTRYNGWCNPNSGKCMARATDKPTIKPTPKPSSTTTPKPVILPCAFTCVPSKIECLENDGVVKSNKFSSKTLYFSVKCRPTFTVGEKYSQVCHF